MTTLPAVLRGYLLDERQLAQLALEHTLEEIGRLTGRDTMYDRALILSGQQSHRFEHALLIAVLRLYCMVDDGLIAKLLSVHAEDVARISRAFMAHAACEPATRKLVSDLRSELDPYSLPIG
ncbi:hypothetical protein GIW81_00765 [Hyphomicrobium sp. xq]|uniref:Uncharacterized protein n=1 Tax=Hyphomicrobium album TaxID=2665159 RepID=A0A6I3KEY7_9HYPH|nr:hypothetical protein [Hyphomicrobium album]MTD92859.1 hypothetical protein [Hyphomicrobium album]